MTLIYSEVCIQFAPISKSTETLSSFAISLAILSRDFHFFSFPSVAISGGSSGISSVEYILGSFTHWIPLSLGEGCFDTLRPSINDDVTF